MTDFTRKLRSWYAANRRDLPWRKTSDPYRIWLSEVILQQTRIEQGIAYYHAFTEKYPTVFDLAASPQQEVLKLWQGLGYYSRARNMHETARRITSLYGGRFPETCKDLLQLKGVGSYTAAAVASIAFNEAVAVIDGNVVRVLARIFGIRHGYKSKEGKKLFEKMADKVLDKNEAGEHNQALMDFGSVFCLPRNPSCEICIFKDHCYAFRNKMIQQLPVKEKKGAVRKRYFSYFVLLKPLAGGYIIYLKKRMMDDIWKNLYDFPVLETSRPCSKLTALNESKKKFGQTNFLRRSLLYKHQLSHRQILARFYLFTVPQNFTPENDLVAANDQQLRTFPVPRLMEKFMENEKYL